MTLEEAISYVVNLRLDIRHDFSAAEFDALKIAIEASKREMHNRVGEKYYRSLPGETHVEDANDFLLNEKLKAYEGEEAKIEKREREGQRVD